MVISMCSVLHVYLELPLGLILIQSIATYTKTRPTDKTDYFSALVNHFVSIFS